MEFIIMSSRWDYLHMTYLISRIFTSLRDLLAYKTTAYGSESHEKVQP
jgi:hypothetical protein